MRLVGPKAETAKLLVTDVADGQFLQRVGDEIVGTDAPGGSSTIPGQSGGTDGRVVRFASANTWQNASQADTIEQLTCCLFRQAGAYYPPGSLITGLSGLTAGSVYYLSTAGNVTATAPTPSSSVRLLVVGKAVSTTTLLFAPGIPIGGE